MITAVDMHLGGYGACADIFPLFIAARRLKVNFVQRLIRSGADVNRMNAIEQTALHVASMHADYNNRILCYPFSIKPHSVRLSQSALVLEFLLENGADIDQRDHNGRTPLHYACNSGYKHFINVLAKNGADAHAKDDFGFTPLDLVACKDYTATKTLIQAYDFPVEEIIEAHELLASVKYHRSAIGAMLQATELRIKHNIPKVILDPEECYNFVKEWESLKELREHTHDKHWLTLQAILAKERILRGKIAITNIDESTKTCKFFSSIFKALMNLQRQVNTFFIIKKSHFNLIRHTGITTF